MVKLLKFALLEPYLGKSKTSMGHTPKSNWFVFLEIKGDHKLLRTCFIKLSYYWWLSVLCDILLPKWAFPAETALSVKFGPNSNPTWKWALP